MQAMQSVALLFLAALCAVHGQATMTLNLLNNYPGAVCIDGTPAGYYFNAGTNTDTDKFFIFLNGGGVCATPSDCLARASTDLGSSKNWPSQIPYGEGYLSSNSSNYFSTWNIAVVQYCDGGRYSSDATNPLVYQNTNLYFKGFTIVKAVIQDLLNGHLMNKATSVVFGGCSAGGEGTYYLLDHARAMIPPQISVHGLADAGWFLDTLSVYGTPSPYYADLPGAYVMWNSSASLNPQCAASMKQGEEWKCLFAQYLYPYQQTPVFMLQSKIDTLQLGSIYELPCDSDFSKCNSTDIAWLKTFTDGMQNSIQQIGKNLRDGVYLVECPIHCIGGDDRWFNTKIQGISPSQAFATWFFDGQTVKLDDKCDYPCNDSCL